MGGSAASAVAGAVEANTLLRARLAPLELLACTLRRNMFDAIAEPARAALYPGHPEAAAAGLEAGALGVAVSGAGSTIVAVVPMPSATKARGARTLRRRSRRA